MDEYTMNSEKWEKLQHITTALSNLNQLTHLDICLESGVGDGCGCCCGLDDAVNGCKQMIKRIEESSRA